MDEVTRSLTLYSVMPISISKEADYDSTATEEDV